MKFRPSLRLLELKIPPPIAALLTAWAMATSTGAPAAPWALRAALFGTLAFTALVIAIAGEWAFHRAKTTINPLKPQNASTLVTNGIYRFTRNPMYLGLTLALLGWAFFLAHTLPFLVPVAFALYIQRFQIQPEERALSKKFGTAFTQYCARTRRWV